MKFASICSGCGGLDFGLERAGLECALQVEIDRSARSVLARHWPDVPKLNDLLQVEPAHVPAVSLFAGGTPCVDLSMAGRRAGLDGARSGLFFKFVALADSQPSAWVLWENVPGALSSNDGLDFAAIVRELTGFEPGVPRDGWRPGGFAVGPKRWLVWRMLDSQYFGVAQRRLRLFVVAGPRERPCPEVLFEPGCLPGDPAPRREAGASVAGSLTVGASSGGGWRVGADARAKAQGGPGFAESDVMYTLDTTGLQGIARARTTRPGQRMEPSSETFGGVIPYHLAQITSPENRANPAPGDPAPSLNGDARLAVAYQCHGSNVGPIGTLRQGNGGVTGGVPFLAHSLTASHDASEDGTGRGTPLVPVLAQSITVSHAKGCASAGNNPGMVNPVLLPSGGVRRLSPVECERLQGWPDQWTRFDEKGRELADGPRYRMIGNGVTSSVAEWLGRRLVKAIGGVQ